MASPLSDDRGGEARRRRISYQLFTAWNRVAGASGDASTTARESRADLLGLPVPGAVELRSRFHLLTDARSTALSNSGAQLELDVWDRQLALSRQADVALLANDTDAVRAAATDLLATVQPGAHLLPVVEAHIALGDAARQDDNIEAAIEHLDTAVQLAEQCEFRFGKARALVSLGYITMQVRSLREAAKRFDEAAEICRELDERMYLANALIGTGEVQSRLRNVEAAERALREGVELSTSIGSNVGMLNGRQHLGDLLRREGRLEEAATHLREALGIAEHTATNIAIVNASDALGEIQLGLGDLDKAEEFYVRAQQTASEIRYLRGQGHAHNGLGQVAQRRQEWEAAEAAHVKAYEIFQRLGDLPSSASTLGALATICAAMDEMELAAHCRLAAVDAIEQMRAAQDHHEYQIEYQERFSYVYSQALRSALNAGMPSAFVAAFEGIAGRRLAGLIGDGPNQAADLVMDAELTGALTALADDRGHTPDGDESMGRPERLARRLGNAALQGALPELSEQALDDVAARLYQRFDPAEGGALLNRVAEATNLLLVTQLPDDPTVVAWLRATDGVHKIEYGSHGLSTETTELVESLALSGLSPTAGPDDLEPLRNLLPTVATDPPADGTLTIVALGALWAIPWPALPIDGGFLGEHVGLALAPSLTLAEFASTPRPLLPPRSVGHWRSPDISHHELQAFVEDERVALDSLTSPHAAVDSMENGGHDLLIVAGHGRLAPGIGHYLDLGHGVLVDPARLLRATPPRLLFLLACWGAVRPGKMSADPLTLATLALARGSQHVGATVSELADDPRASQFVNDALYRLPEMELPHALRRATQRLLSTEDGRRGPLSRWAPLITVGVCNREPS